MSIMRTSSVTMDLVFLAILDRNMDLPSPDHDNISKYVESSGIWPSSIRSLNSSPRFHRNETNPVTFYPTNKTSMSVKITTFNKIKSFNETHK